MSFKYVAGIAALFYLFSLGVALWHGDIRMALAVFNTLIWVSIAVLSMD